MGVLPSSKAQASTPSAAKRRSAQLDFSNLGPLKTTGTVGFSAFRDAGAESAKRRRARNKSNGSAGAMDEDSDDDDDEPEILGKMDDIDEKDVKSSTAPEDVKFTGELAEGVDRIRVRISKHAFVLSLRRSHVDVPTIAQAPTLSRARGLHSNRPKVSQPQCQPPGELASHRFRFRRRDALRNPFAPGPEPPG